MDLARGRVSSGEGSESDRLACAMCRMQFGENDTEFGLSVERFRPVHAKWVEHWPAKSSSRRGDVIPTQLGDLVSGGGRKRRVYVCFKCHQTVEQVEELLIYQREAEGRIIGVVEDRWKIWPRQVEENEEEEKEEGEKEEEEMPRLLPVLPVQVETDKNNNNVNGRGQVVPFDPVVANSANSVGVGRNDGNPSLVVRNDARLAIDAPPPLVVSSSCVGAQDPVMPSLTVQVTTTSSTSFQPLPQEPCCSKSLTAPASSSSDHVSKATENENQIVKTEVKRESRGRKRKGCANTSGGSRRSRRNQSKKLPDLTSQPILRPPRGYPFTDTAPSPNAIMLSQPGMRLAAAKSITLFRAQIKQLSSRSFVDEESLPSESSQPQSPQSSPAAPPKKKRKTRLPTLSNYGSTTATARAHASRIRKSVKKISNAARQRQQRPSTTTTSAPRMGPMGRRTRIKRQLASTSGNIVAINCPLCDVKFALDSGGDKVRLERSWKLAQESVVVHFGNAHNPVRKNMDVATNEDGLEYYACTACSFKAFVDHTSLQPQRNLRINAHVKLSRHYLRIHGQELKTIIPSSTPRRAVSPPRPVTLFGSPQTIQVEVSQSFGERWRQCPHPECTFEASLPGEGEIVLKPATYRRVELKLARHYLRVHEFESKFKVSGKHPCVKTCNSGSGDGGNQLCFACPRCPYEKNFETNSRSEKTSRDTALSLFLRHFYRNHVFKSSAFSSQGQSQESAAPAAPAPAAPAPAAPAPAAPAPAAPVPPQEIAEETVVLDKKPNIAEITLSSQSKEENVAIHPPIPPVATGSKTTTIPVTLMCPEGNGRIFEFEVDIKPIKIERIATNGGDGLADE